MISMIARPAWLNSMNESVFMTHCMFGHTNSGRQDLPAVDLYREKHWLKCVDGCKGTRPQCFSSDCNLSAARVRECQTPFMQCITKVCKADSLQIGAGKCSQQGT